MGAFTISVDPFHTIRDVVPGEPMSYAESVRLALDEDGR
jgi:hypothetical protein